MKLKYLLRGIHYQIVQGSDEIMVDGISWDSRKVINNSVFICVQGRNVDRHNYALQALLCGATALVVEKDLTDIPKGTTIIKVEDSKHAFAVMAAAYYNHPSAKFNLIGITGTNGKTSTAYFAAKILDRAKGPTGIIGTIENSIGGKPLKTEKLNPTTPDPLELQKSFAEMLQAGASDVVMEVTSSALDRRRVDKCDFDIGVFTNLTQDHLEEHGTMENYKNAKLKLFKMCKQAVANADDAICNDIVKTASCKVLTYGIDNEADFKASNIKYSLRGVNFILSFKGEHFSVDLKVPGKFSVYNALAAIAACYLSGLTLEQIIDGVNSIKGVKGRFETIPNNRGCMIVVDYAHSPDGLQNILSSLKDLAEKRIITVFGCGGNRDKTKRPIMGEIAGRLSDYIIITSDNPRYENPQDIIDEIEVGLRKTTCAYEKICDRHAAIATAVMKTQPGDIVLIAGKGHENYQIIGDKTIHFDDTEVVKEFLLFN